MKILWACGIIIFILVVVVISLYSINFYGPLSSNRAVWGQFGDYVGGLLNPIIAFAALLALLYTIYHQKTELYQLLEKQNFESTYFQLLRLYSDLVAEMHFEENVLVFPRGSALIPPITEKKSFNDRECFKRLHEILLEKYIIKADRGDYNNNNRTLDLRDAYNEFYDEFGHLVGHYFRTLYNIVKFVEESYLDDDGLKKSYVNMLRAQLSKYELGLLLYNCLSTHGQGFAPNVRKYNLIKHIEDSVQSRLDDKTLLVS